MKGLFLGKHLSMESEGETQVERELCIWALMDNPQVLKEATHAEKQEQVSVKVPKMEGNFIEGVIRIRKTEDKDGQVKYTLTIKQDHRARGEGKTETEAEVSEDMYIQLAGLATEKVVKHRYLFPVEGTDYTWEVDAAPDGKGGYHPWVRMELEMADTSAALPPFPFIAKEELLPDGRGKFTQEEYEAKNKELFDAYFVRKGPLVRYTDGGQTEETEGESSAPETEDTE